MPERARETRARRLKLQALRLLEHAGIFAAIGRTSWRRDRLVVLCYHGSSIRDEHDWNSELYMPPSLLSSRIDALRREGCTVLSLSEGLARVRAGSLPARSVALTFDDGMVDFALRAWPLLETAAVPATVYLTSYYSALRLPIFGLLVAYLLWRGRGHEVLPRNLFDLPEDYSLKSHAGRIDAVAALRQRCRERGICAEQRHELALRLAEWLGVDIEPILADRRLTVMTREEVAAVARAGADVQLHTHRHRVPLDEAMFTRELQENRDYIFECIGRTPTHFCYPSGEWYPIFFPWLKALRVESATVGERGYVTRATSLMTVPRFADTCAVTDLEFRAWVTGAYRLLPQRPQRALATVR